MGFGIIPEWRVWSLMLMFSYTQRPLLAARCSGYADCRACTTGGNLLMPCVWSSKQHRCGHVLEMLAPAAGSTISLAYDCPLTPPPKTLYVDMFARTRALPYIAAANAHDLKGNHFPHVQILERVLVQCDRVRSECMAYIAYDPTERALVLTFRSTDSAAQLIAEALNFLLQTQKDFQPVGGHVVSYFYDAFFALWNSGLERKLRSALIRHPDTQLWIFGHSLGGALASLAAAWISRMGIVKAERLKFLSFGQPRTGDIDYARAFDALVPYKYRVVHRSDPVTQMPMRIPLLTPQLMHHRYEVFYKNDMGPRARAIVCLRAEDPTCSQSQSDPADPHIHRNYFNVSLLDWALQGCPKESPTMFPLLKSEAANE